MSLAVVGNPVSHSKSPLIHTAALAEAGIDGRYRAITVDDAGMDRVARWVRSGRLFGANITMPHKRRAYDLSDTASDVARRTRSVNTWVRSDGAVEGYSTDGEGLRYAWKRNGLGDTDPVLILGSGGVAAAALVALEHRELWVSARSEQRAAELCDAVGVSASFLPWGAGLPGAVLVNATPVGTNGEVFDDAVLAGCTGYLEMVYGQRPTASELVVRNSGRPVAPGIDMLVGQAMASFAIWTGVSAPESAMWASVTG